MFVHRIDTLDEFEAVKSNWQSVYASDSHAHIFSSWAWLRGYIQSTTFSWMALAVKADPNLDAYCGFLFLTLESKALTAWRILRLGGSPLADYTGFVCSPELEKQALTAAAEYITSNLGWDQLHLWDVKDPRLKDFLKTLSATRFTITANENIPCPYIELPDSWDEFLLTKLSKTVRKKVRRRTQQNADLPGFRIEETNRDNLQAQIDTIFELWSKKWQQPADQGLRPIFEQLFDAGALWLASHWDGNTPMAALAGFVDLEKGVFYAFMGAYNSEYEKLSPGIVLDGASMRFAIENGLFRYDYLRGDHEYKFRWGAEQRSVPRIEITRNTARSAAMSKAIGFAKKLKSF